MKNISFYSLDYNVEFLEVTLNVNDRKLAKRGRDRTDGAARGEPSLLELSRVVTEENVC